MTETGKQKEFPSIMEAKAFMRLNPEYKYLYPVISGSSGHRAAREGVSKLELLKNEPVRRFLRERETIVPRKKLVDIFGHQVTRLDIHEYCKGLKDHPPWDKETAEGKVPQYVTPCKCFIIYTGWKKGYEPIGWPCDIFPCAHYVAHNFDIKSGKKTARCQEKYAIKITQITKWIKEQNWAKRQYGVQIRTDDIWINPKGSHTGFVSHVEPGKVLKVKISHCSSGNGNNNNMGGTPAAEDAGLKTMEKCYKADEIIYGARFYGPAIKTNWLGNMNPISTELHDLSNTKTNCQIGEIILKVYFPSKEFGLNCGYDGCAYCLPDYHTR